MNYRTTRKADQDIIDIYVQGASSFGTARAETYYSGLVATFALLAANPYLTRKRAEFTPPVRLYPYEAHMVVYVEDSGGILVVRVLHGRQDWQRHL